MNLGFWISDLGFAREPRHGAAFSKSHAVVAKSEIGNQKSEIPE